MTDFSGSWRVNLQKSKFLGPQPDHIVVEIKHVEPRLEQSMIVTTAAGEERLDCVVTIGGEESANVIRGADWRTKAYWEGGELILESLVNAQAREFRFRDCWSISPEGTLVMEHRDDDLAGQRAVLDRV